jgi:hypothetical protein
MTTFSPSLESRLNPSIESRLKIVSWNLLAAPYTRHNTKQHRSGEHQESLAQTKARYCLAGTQLLEFGADALLLQECEKKFFDPVVNAAAEQLLAEFTVYGSFDHPNKTGKKCDPGTAVLLRNNRLAAAGPQVVVVGGGLGSGGASKTTTMVRVADKLTDRRFILASGHFAYDGKAHMRKYHVELLKPHLLATTFIIGGDWNCDTNSPCMTDLFEHTWLKTQASLCSPEYNLPTILDDRGQPKCIDHFVLSRSHNLVVESVVTEGKPVCPYQANSACSGSSAKSPATIVAASDHIPIVLRLLVQGGNAWQKSGPSRPVQSVGLVRNLDDLGEANAASTIDKEDKASTEAETKDAHLQPPKKQQRRDQTVPAALPSRSKLTAIEREVLGYQTAINKASVAGEHSISGLAEGSFAARMHFARHGFMVDRYERVSYCPKGQPSRFDGPYDDFCNCSICGSNEKEHVWRIGW